MLGFIKKQSGDTIVEVMIAMAVISLVLVAAYITTTRNITRVEDTQEHSQALQLAQSQIELLRDTSLGSGNSCFTSAGVAKAAGPSGNDPCTVASNDVQAVAGTEPAYAIRITPPLTGTTYKIDIAWDSNIANTKNHVTLYYQP